MRLIAFTVALIGGILVSYTARSFASGEACTLITQIQVSAALEVPVGAGTPIASPSTCQWIGKGRFATLTITQPLGGKGPVDRFNAGKTSTMPGITIEPISGVGDDATMYTSAIRRGPAWAWSSGRAAPRSRSACTDSISIERSLSRRRSVRPSLGKSELCSVRF